MSFGVLPMRKSLSSTSFDVYPTHPSAGNSSRMIISNLSRRALLYRSMRDFFILALTFSGCVASSIAQVTPGGMVSGNFLNNTTEGGGYQFQSFNFSRTLGIDYWSKRTASAEAFGDAQRLGVLKSPRQGFARR
jgi:hypothetical protein